MALLGGWDFKIPEFKIPSFEDVTEWASDTFEAGLESAKITPVGGVLGGLGSVAKTGLALAGGAAAGAIGGLLLGGKQEQKQQAAPQVIDDDTKVTPEITQDPDPVIEPDPDPVQNVTNIQETHNISNVTNDFSSDTTVEGSENVWIGAQTQAAEVQQVPTTELIAHPVQTTPTVIEVPTTTVSSIDISKLFDQLQDQQQQAEQGGSNWIMILALAAGAYFILKEFRK